MIDFPEMARGVDISLYDDQGRITTTVTASPSTLQGYVETGVAMVLGTFSPSLHMVVAGAVQDRPPHAVKLQGSTLSGLVVGSKLVINQAEYLVTDTTAELDFTHPGTYDVRVLDFPLQDAVFEVTKQ